MTDLIVEVTQAVALQLDVTPVVLQLDVQAGLGGPQGVPGTNSIPMTIRGTMGIATGIIPYPMPENRTIVKVLCAVATAPTGSYLEFDILKNGVSIFTGTFPRILAGATVGAEVVPTTTALLAGDVLTVDIKHIGSVQPGAYATVVFVVA